MSPSGHCRQSWPGIREVIYIVLGATHPYEFRRDGNSYVASLERLAERCGVREHVVFFNRYVSSEELARFLAAADLYITPYANREQIASGTLAMALGMGKAVLSTPYRYAEEMLAEDRGVLFPFGDSSALAESANALIEDPERWDTLRARAYAYSRTMIWKEVARRYVDLVEKVVEDRQLSPRPPHAPRARAIDLRRDARDQPGPPEGPHGRQRHHPALPVHGAGSHARLLHGRQLPRPHCGHPPPRSHAGRGQRSTSPRGTCPFSITPSTGPAREFRNFLCYERTVVDEAAERGHLRPQPLGAGHRGRLGSTDAVLPFACRLFTEALPAAEKLISPRAWAFALLGACSYLQRFSGDERAAPAPVGPRTAGSWRPSTRNGISRRGRGARRWSPTRTPPSPTPSS